MITSSSSDNASKEQLKPKTALNCDSILHTQRKTKLKPMRARKEGEKNVDDDIPKTHRDTPVSAETSTS